MSSENPPLTCADVKAILKYLGFSAEKNRATSGSHEQWTNPALPGEKVTVDCPNAPFSQNLITSMANQAKSNKKTFYAIHRLLNGMSTKKDKRLFPQFFPNP
jgi:predicted RNA binding protein YcfA (HicA-like mRNA interferase family)